MGPFQRSIISGLGLTVTTVALAIDWLTGLEIPTVAWGSWVLANVGWVFYCARRTTTETRRNAEKAEAVIAAIVKRASQNGARG